MGLSDSSNGASRDRQFRSQGIRRFSALQNLENLIVGQLLCCRVMPSTTTFSVHVGDVLRLRPPPEVIGSNTARCVAVVQNADAIRDRAIAHLVHQAMYEVPPAPSPPYFHDSIASCVHCSKPQPATVKVDGNLSPDLIVETPWLASRSSHHRKPVGVPG